VEKRLQELKEKLDQDKDGKPDLVGKAFQEVQKALEEAKARLAELDQDKDGIPDKLKALSEKASQAAEADKAKAEEAARPSRNAWARGIPKIKYPVVACATTGAPKRP